MIGLINTLVLAMAAALPGLPDDQQARPGDPIAGLPVQDGWRPHAGNPFLSLGEHRPLASWNDPCVLKREGKYIMYLTTSLRAPGQPPVQPFRAVSDDGLVWNLEPKTPLLDPGKDASDFDFQSVETPSVVSFKGRFHLYYTGVRKGMSGPMAIGHATSDDGIRWTKDPNNPVLRPTGHPSDFNGIHVAEPGALVRGDAIYLYHTSVGLRPGGDPPVRRVIALAKSADASHFEAPKVVLGQSDLFPPKLGFDGYSTPSALIHDGRVHLFYDVGYFSPHAEHQWTQVALHHAVSDDGETGWSQDPEVIFTNRSFGWTSLEIRSPTALFEGDVLHLWFAGNARVEELLPEVRRSGRTRKFGIGYATRRAAPDAPPRR
jgi:predicted GH43/DUF377 family glycosyl hydrolase